MIVSFAAQGRLYHAIAPIPSFSPLLLLEMHSEELGATLDGESLLSITTTYPCLPKFRTTNFPQLNSLIPAYYISKEK
ncbi:MAG: hypothetical protein RSA77_09960, partial [Clostridium sp.]